jgi:putative tryptophan/tyrosine transport system substrate-binding protein
MRRRAFIGTLGAIVAAPVLARADQAMPVIGFLNTTAPAPWAARVAAFRRGLGEIGYVEGQNVAIEYRWAEGHYDRLPQLAADLVTSGVAVIVATGGSTAGRAAKAATTSIPIVVTTGVDPVATGLVSSLNRPDANVTGINLLSSELRTKRLEVLRDLIPTAKVVAILFNQTNPSFDKSAALTAAQRMGLQAAVLEASSESEIDRAFASLAERRADALLVDADAFFESRRDQFVALAARERIPAIFDTRDFPEIGGLISYGPDYSVAYREAGVYAGRILRGAKPSELPVAQLSKVELVVNAKTAKALGLTIPPAILTRADEVIE